MADQLTSLFKGSPPSMKPPGAAAAAAAKSPLPPYAPMPSPRLSDVEPPHPHERTPAHVGLTHLARRTPVATVVLGSAQKDQRQFMLGFYADPKKALCAGTGLGPPVPRPLPHAPA
eukprot:gene7028-6674_t